MNLLRLKNIISFILLLISTSALFSRPAEYDFTVTQPLNFRSITINDGLSQNWVRCIYQDDQGFMWFGASGGLNRYDGYEITVYDLGNVNVNSIAGKSKEELWICNDLGVLIYNRKTDVFQSFQHFKGQTVLSMLQEGDSAVWFGTNTGLFRYTHRDARLKKYDLTNKAESGASDNYINMLFQDSDHTLWIGTKAGLVRYERATGSFTRYQASVQEGSLSGNDVMAICEDHDKRIWIGTAKEGVHLMIPENGDFRFKKVADGAVLSLLVDRENTLWIGAGSSGGIMQIDLDKFSTGHPPEIIRIKKNPVDPASLSDNSIFSMYEDRLNDIWIGTFGGGVNYFSYRSKKFFSVKEGISAELSLSNALVNAIWEEERYLWIGTEGGLDRYDKLTHQSRHFQHDPYDPSSLSSDPVYTLYKDSRNNFWIGTWAGGLNLFDYKTNSFEHFIPDQDPGSISSENVFSVFEDSRHNLWIGTVSGGLNRYNYETESFTHYRHDPDDPNSLNSDIIQDINETHDGRLLLATYGSLEMFDYSADSFTHVPLNDPQTDKIGQRYILTIFIDSRNNIWLGSNEGLLLFNEAGGTFTQYTMHDGLPGNTIQEILEDGHGNLWISTNNGLSKFTSAAELPETPEFINFNEPDGLAGNEFKRRAAFRNKKGMMYFGTSQGFSYFHPDSISLNKTVPEVIFAEMRLLQKRSGTDSEVNSPVPNINGVGKVELPYNGSDFSISFAALNYLCPENNQYKYMLRGYDPDWVVAGTNRTATYKNLHPGKYTFMVLGSNNDGTWSTTPRTLEIIINPPFWQTWWFRIAAVTLLLGLVLLIFSLRVRNIKREKRKLARLVAERTTKLSEANDKLEEQSEELKNQNEELRQNQEQLSLYKDHLEELVAQRTTELEKAKTKAEESDRLKSTFLANMSHEIRTPLNAITGFAGLFDDPDTDAEERGNFSRIIQANSNTLLRLIDDILDLSAIQANQLAIHLIHFPPMEILRELYRQFLPQAKDTIEFLLKTYENGESLTICSDEYRFRQILSNLLSNAFKFTESGTIEMGFRPYSETHVLFYVTDTGIGITKKEQEIIFNQFTKAEKKTKIFRGAGLGLAICRQLTELLGGKIWLESAAGKGSAFYFTLPRTE